MNKVLAVLRSYDRMPSNVDFPDGNFVERVLSQYGYITLFIFVCPATRGKYLISDKKELFMPIEEPGDGLLFARIPKLKNLVTNLWQIGVPSRLLFVVADNSYELYRGPVEKVVLNTDIMDRRRAVYSANLTTRLLQEFPQMLEIFSLGLNKIGLAPETVSIPADVMEQEINFQKQIVYSRYYDSEKPKDDVVEKIVKGKCLAYAEQGLLIEASDALLIGTEGSDTIASWLLRTNMLKLAGAKFPVIYPYIRKEVTDVKAK